jgi:protein SEY1
LEVQAERNVVDELGKEMTKVRGAALEEFERLAGRYHHETYLRKMGEVKGQVDFRLLGLFRGQVKALQDRTVKKFYAEVASGEGDFAIVLRDARGRVTQEFEVAAKEACVEGTGWTYCAELTALDTALNEICIELRKEELGRILDRLEKSIKNELEEPMSAVFGKPNERIWDTLIEQFNEIKLAKTTALSEMARIKVGAEEGEIALAVRELKTRAWMSLRTRLESETEATHLLLRLREL